MNITYAQFCSKTGFSTDPKEQRPRLETNGNDDENTWSEIWSEYVRECE